jgi:RNA polymerase sigma-B factor
MITTVSTSSSRLTLPASPDSAARARQYLRETATLDSMRHAEADLLVTELIGNAIQHSPDAEEITIELATNDRGLVVTVSHLHPHPLQDPVEGVGYTLLRRLSPQWGHDHDGESLSVWFVVRTPGTSEIPSDLSDADLFARMPDDPSAYAEELVRRHRDLAESICNRYRGRGVDDDDLLQVANMALLKAILRYDASIGDIRPYAAATISGEMKRLLRDKGWAVRVPRSLQERSQEVMRATTDLEQKIGRPPEIHELAEHLDMSEDEVAEAFIARKAYVSNSMDSAVDQTGVTFLDRLEDEDIHLSNADERLIIESAIARLPKREQLILHLRFNEDLTQAEIADEVGVSQMHVSRLLAKALDELRSLIDS